MSDAPRNIPVPDALAEVRARMKELETQEAELRNLLIANPDIREGAAWLAEVKVSQRETTDIKEMRACHPDLVAEFTHALDVTRVVLSGITEDGELVSVRAMRSAAKSGDTSHE
jgi:hypothetical protein